jgi:methylated-DNA-[protein]-cysteine S-methyltransferase
VDEVTRVVSSPLGALALVATRSGLTRIEFVDAATTDKRSVTHPHLDAAEQQLSEFFAGRRREFDLVLEPVGTAFQLAAWAVLRSIPFGTTMSYGDQARAMGRPTAVRAVGGANGRNPLAIVVPCHRVVGSNGRLTGYASGVDRKAWLLGHEQINL